MRSPRLFLFCLILLGAPLSGWAADGEPSKWADGEAESRVLSSALRAAGWDILTVPGRPSAHFAAVGPEAVSVSAESAVAFLYRPVPEIDREARRLSWRWRVDEFVPDTDLSATGKDDRSLALHICFPADLDEMSFWQRVGHSIESTFSAPLAGRVLTYVWGGVQPVGSELANPHLDSDGKTSGTIIVLRSGGEAGGRWIMEEVDFVADFERIYGYPPPPPAYLAISADSDDTMTRALAFVDKLSFVR